MAKKTKVEFSMDRFGGIELDPQGEFKDDACPFSGEHTIYFQYGHEAAGFLTQKQVEYIEREGYGNVWVDSYALALHYGVH